MKPLILALLTGAALAASSPAHAAVKTIALVHGAFADGSVTITSNVDGPNLYCLEARRVAARIV